jgi:hypothetical protein
MSATSLPVTGRGLIGSAAVAGAAGVILLAAVNYARSAPAAEAATAVDPVCISAKDPGGAPSRPDYPASRDASHPGLTAYYAVSLRWLEQPHECRGLILHSIVQRKIFRSRTHAA